MTPKPSTLSPVLASVLAFFFGAMVTLALAPYHLWPCAIISLMGLQYCLQTATPRQALWRGWWYGLGLFGAGVSWIYVSIHVHGNAPVPLAAFLTALFCAGMALMKALFAWAWVRFLRGGVVAALLAFPALWVLFDWWQSWILTGFPWLFTGYGFIDQLLAGWAPLLGIYGVNFTVALSASACHVLLSRSGRNASIAAVAALVTAWLGGAVLQQQDWTVAVDEAEITVALIQPNIPLEKKWDRQYFPHIVADFRDQTLANIDSDIILWPESAIPAFYQRLGSVMQPLATAAAENNASLILGVPYQADDKKRYYNSIVALGRGDGAYFKQRLVPFGEYVPLEDWLRGLIDFFDLPMSHFSVGPKQQNLLLAGRWKIAPYICYEIVYPDLVAHSAGKADVLMTISNDSWFGDSIGPLQHLQMAQMRALENGRYVIRGTNNGVTAIINERGKIIASEPQFEKTVLRGKAQAFSGSTPFSRHGSLPILVFCAAILLASVILTRKFSQ